MQVTLKQDPVENPPGAKLKLGVISLFYLPRYWYEPLVECYLRKDSLSFCFNQNHVNYKIAIGTDILLTNNFAIYSSGK